MKLKINIVGLTHNDVKQDSMEYARSAEGNQLKLLSDKQNAYDPMAVKVYDGSLFVGYVAAQDLEDVQALMLASGKKVLRAICTGFKTKEDGASGLYLTAVVTARVEGEAEILEGITVADFGCEAGESFIRDTNDSSIRDAKEPSIHAAKWHSIPELEVSGGKVISMSSDGKMLPMPSAMSQAYQEIYDDHAIENWHYSGPDFSIDRLARIDDCTDMLEDSLVELVHQKMEYDKLVANVNEKFDDCTERTDSSMGKAWKEKTDLVENINMLEEEAAAYLSDFIQNHRFDYSREMTQMRKHIQTLLKLLEIRNVKEQGQQESWQLLKSLQQLNAQREVLLSEMGYLTCSKYREEAAHIFFIDTPIEKLKKQTGNYDFTDRIDEIEQELESFPDELYRKFKADPVDFLREIFYKRIPRKQMKQLLSGIIFMIMNHRVDDVKQWGKNDDKEALLEMKTLEIVNHNQEENNRLLADKCVREIAVAQNRTGYGWLIKSQADWYVVMRVLQEEGLLPSADHGEFERYIAQIFQEKVEGRQKVPLCKKKDLDQAELPVFEKNKPADWAKISEEKLVGIQSAKYNRYLAIVDAMLKIIGR